MNTSDFIHPDDAAAIKSLESIPALSAIMKKVLDLNAERYIHGVNLASKVKLSPTQLPDLYGLLPPICKRLGIQEPEFYLELDPNPNAYTFGDTYTSITINTGIVELMDHDELVAILAHECGHIICRHLLYHSLSSYLFEMPTYVSQLGLSELAEPIKAMLLSWNRISELSADRVSAFIVGPQTAIRALSRLAGAPDDLNLEEFARQADIYDEVTDGTLWDRYIKTTSIINKSHPFTAIRVREILRWVASGELKRLNEKYPH